MNNINITIGDKTFTVDYTTSGKTFAASGNPVGEYLINGKKVTEHTWFASKAKAEIAIEYAA